MRGLNPRPSPCEGDVITTTPTKRARILFSGIIIKTISLRVLSCSLAVSHLLEDLVDVGGVALGTLLLPLSSGSGLLGGLGGFLAGLLGHFDSFCEGENDEF